MSPDEKAFTPVNVTAVTYHTVDHATTHDAGEAYDVADPALLETLIAIGFAVPTVSLPPPEAK